MSSPPPCPSPPRGGGGASLPISKKNVFVPYCTGLCHCDTLLSEIMVTSFVLTPRTPQTPERLAKTARGTWGLGHTFGDKLYFTRSIPEAKWIPKKLEAPTVAKPAPKPAAKRGKQAAAKPAAASASIPVADGEHVQLFKTLWDRKRKFYTVPVQNKGHAQN